jgi:hypothetical protein
MKFLVSLISFVFAANSCTALIVVQTQHGPVEGTIKTTDLGKNYFHFMGIPYARPPVGSLMFRVSLWLPSGFGCLLTSRLVFRIHCHRSHGQLL